MKRGPLDRRDPPRSSTGRPGAVEDLRYCRPPLVHHALDELVAGRGELEQEVAPAGGVGAAVEQTGEDQAITGPRRVDGCTPMPSATAARLSGPRLATITSDPSCGGVTTSSTGATERALTPMSTRAASMTASTSSVASDATLATALLCTQRLRST